MQILCCLVSVGFVKPLSFSFFSHTFRQPPHPTSSQPRGQADAAGPAESYRLYHGFPHGRRRRVTKALLKFGVQSLPCLLLPWCAHANKHDSGHRTTLRKTPDISHALISSSQMETLLGDVWTHSSALSDDIKMPWLHTTGVSVRRGSSSLFWCQITPNWVWKECRNAIYLQSRWKSQLH